MKTNSVPDSVSQYVVVFRALSAPMFPRGKEIKIDNTTSLGTVRLTYRTHHVNIGLAHPLPGDLWIDARGPANSVENAVSVFGGIIGTLTPIISFSTNAAISDLEPELVFNNTYGLKTRDFLQSMLPGKRPIVHVGRKVNSEATIGLINAIETSSEKDRIVRAILQYSLALRHWRWGHETLATAHLYIGMETLTQAVIRSRLAASNINHEQFARDLGINPDNLAPNCTLPQAIEVAVRKHLLFQGDDQCYKDAKDASDGFEHGFMPFDKIRNKARAVRDKTAKYLRKAILDLVGIENTYRDILLATPYNVPLGNWPVVKYIRGQLLGDSDNLAAKGKKYPVMSWRSTIKSVDFSESGEYDIKFEETLRAHLDNGISFQPGSFEVWAP
jgi:hypothetical protein